MSLFKVQDYDCPKYVVAKDFGQAQQVWTNQFTEEVEPSLGIEFLCEDSDLILFGLLLTAPEKEG